VVRFKEGKGFAEGVRAVWLYPHKSVAPRHLRRWQGGRRLQADAAGKIQDAARHEVRRDLRQPEGVESKKEWEEDGKKHWAIYKKALETDFKAGRPAS